MEISKEELQQILATAVGAAVAEVKKMNPLEEEKFHKEMELKKRRNRMQVEFAKIEEEAARRKKFGCTHSRYPSGHRLAGNMCPRGQGEWMTSGQVNSKGIASMICVRCASVWLFKVNTEEMQNIIDGGLAGVAPPEESVCLHQRCYWCSDFFTQDEYKAHDKDACKAKAEHIAVIA